MAVSLVNIRHGRLRVLLFLATCSALGLLYLFYSASTDAVYSPARLRHSLPAWVFPQAPPPPPSASSSSAAAAAAAAAPVVTIGSFKIPTGPNVKIPDWLLPPEDKPEAPSILTFPPDPPNQPFLIAANTPSSPDLQSRLQAFLDAPAPSRGRAYQLQIMSCSRSIFHADNDQVHLNRQFWISDTDSGTSAIRLWRSRLVRALESTAKRGEALVAPQGEPLEGSKGLVYAPRTQQDIEDILISLRWIRNHLKSTIPIELWYSAAPSSHLNLAESRWKSYSDALTGLQATVRALPPHVQASAPTSKSPPHIRAAAMLASSFTKVLYLDGTSLPLQDPLSLFTSSAFLQGYPLPAALTAAASTISPPKPLYTPSAVLWPSIHQDSNDNPIWRFVGSPCNSDHWQIDAAQMLVDKRGNGGLNLAALHIAAYMQDASQPSTSTAAAAASSSDAVTVEAQQDGRGGAEFFSRLSSDGQEALRYAFMVLGLNYTSAPVWPSLAGNLVESRQLAKLEGAVKSTSNGAKSFCGHALVHYDLETMPYVAPAGAHKSWLRKRSRRSDARKGKATQQQRRGPVPPTTKTKEAQPLFLHLNLTSSFLAAHTSLPAKDLFTHLQSFSPNKVGDQAFEKVQAGVTVIEDTASAHAGGTGAGAGTGEARFACLSMWDHEDPYTKMFDAERVKLGLPPVGIKVEALASLSSSSAAAAAAAGSAQRWKEWIESYWSARSR
ncbi:hypothetical protein OC846_006054 [Tilletia horrida]|uniref:Uncharacterized protein n=1 Tax=Tilletia horrida TaxID=155126 RepID=A0AAN6GPD7_9BASI|nr:hypothetical protein OC846_006054 [Tilletia horrida]